MELTSRSTILLEELIFQLVKMCLTFYGSLLLFEVILTCIVVNMWK